MSHGSDGSVCDEALVATKAILSPLGEYRGKAMSGNTPEGTRTRSSPLVRSCASSMLPLGDRRTNATSVASGDGAGLWPSVMSTVRPSPVDGTISIRAG